MPPVIQADLCKRCGKCAEACPSDVFYPSVKGEIPSVTYPDECWHCNACVEECPHEGAIRLRIALPLSIVYKDRPA
ncbi:MAG: ferredoxin family protein [Thermodesulfobacteriota bacterium]